MKIVQNLISENAGTHSDLFAEIGFGTAEYSKVGPTGAPLSRGMPETSENFFVFPQRKLWEVPEHRV